MKSIEDASILRKFTVFFLLMSIIPVVTLYYLYWQVKESGNVGITEANFSMTLGLIIVGAVTGYWAMRSVLKKLIAITKSSQKTLEIFLEPDKLKNFTGEQNEISVLAQSFTEITTRLEDNIRKLELAKRTLHSVLSKVGQGISSMQSIDTFLDLIVETVADAFSGRVGILMLTDKSENEMYLKTIYGSRLIPLPNIRMKFSDEPLNSILRSRKALVVEKIENSVVKSNKFNLVFETPMLCAPLILHDEVLGIIAVCGKKSDDKKFQDDEMNLLSNLAFQTAVAVENSKLNKDVEKTYFETISALALAVDAKDKYSRGHLDRVASYCVKIAEKLKLSQDDITVLRDAARLHDVGKIGIPDEILMKPAPLSDKEMEMMKKHAEIGESIIKPVHSLRSLCDIVRHHHEKLDGSGYPDGLQGDQIALLVRISVVADIFDALTTDRPYRKRYPAQEALNQLRAMKDKIDQDIVEALSQTGNLE
ncbi:MAG: HD domain-containing phosphohydrolase [Candidatus Omnitrophota bacterium]